MLPLPVLCRDELGKNINADEAAAMGAVYQAAALSKAFKVKPFLIRDAVIFPIQVGVLGVMLKDAWWHFYNIHVTFLLFTVFKISLRWNLAVRLRKRKVRRESSTTSAFCFRGWRHIPSVKSSPSTVTQMTSFSKLTTETSASSAKTIRSEFAVKHLVKIVKPVLQGVQLEFVKINKLM